MADARLFSHVFNRMSLSRAVMFAPLTQGERIEEMASTILDQMPLRAAVAGVGLGGIVALELLRRAPDRISRIALMSTTPLADTPPVSAERETRIVRARSGRLEAVMSEEVPQSALTPGAGRIAVAAEVQRMAHDLGADVFVRQSRAMQRRRDQQSTLRKCKVPAAVICGAHDTLIPVKRQSFMAELIPDATLEVVEGAGHLPVLEAPEATLDALERWLALAPPAR
ncbi:MAG: alpha/beta hydrolase [Rhodobacteraceae bacterium]|nr:alpha/beta hydrolase [Paracoccaceae bacterium]